MIQRLLRLPIILVALCVLATGIAIAQLRTLPQNVQYARVGESQPLPVVQLNGKLLRLAPGGVIYDENNRSIVHGALPPGARVAYSIDIGGDVGRIYILSASELAQIDSKQ